MPLYTEWSPDKHSLAAIWHVDEDEAFFQTRTGVITEIRHPKKRLEHLAGRYLLQHLKVDFPLHHITPDQHDKPRVPEDRYFFSISHSHPYVAAVLSDAEECGIDIQCWHPNIERIAHMFLSEEELRLCASSSSGGSVPTPREGQREAGRSRRETITLAWSAKEAAYKWHGRRGADFIRDLPIKHFLEESTARCPPNAPDYFRVEMKCYDIDIQPVCALFGDFALAYLVMQRSKFI